MKYSKILVAGVLCLSSLYGCWFIIVPVGPIVRAIQGPRYCVDQNKKVGDRIKTPGGKEGTITKIHGEDSKCINPSHPILANVTFDEKKQPENKNDKNFFPVQNEVRMDSRFIAYDNGTVLDTSTNLMWAAKDNGDNLMWADAKFYCENYRGGGYTNWRMPTQDELAGLYDSVIKGNNGYHLTKLITLTGCCSWASETHDSAAALFDFIYGGRNWFRPSSDHAYRALPVRSVKTVTVAQVPLKEQPEVSSASETAENFGMTVQDITTEVAKYLGIASNSGVIIVDVKHGSNADKTGIQPRDIIMQVYKVKISSLKEYLREISKKSAENSVLLLMKRGKATFYVKLDR